MRRQGRGGGMGWVGHPGKVEGSTNPARACLRPPPRPPPPHLGHSCSLATLGSPGAPPSGAGHSPRSRKCSRVRYWYLRVWAR